MDGPFRDLIRLRRISIAQIVFGILGVLGMLGGVRSWGSSTPGTSTIVYGFLHNVLMGGTGILGVFIVDDCRFRNSASSGKFLASVVCNSVLATLSILGAVGCAVCIVLVSTLLNNLPVQKNAVGSFDQHEHHLAETLGTVVLVLYVIGLISSVFNASLSIVAAKTADGNRLMIKTGLKCPEKLSSNSASDRV